MKNLTPQELKQFFAERKAVTVSGIAKEAGYTGRYLQMILDGDKPLSDKAREKLVPILHFYGWGNKLSGIAGQSEQLFCPEHEPKVRYGWQKGTCLTCSKKLEAK